MKRNSYKLNPTEELYIALEDLDFTWYSDEIEKVIELWNQGANVVEIAEKVRKAPWFMHSKDHGQYEVVILLMDLARREKIEPRPGGLLGGDNHGGV